VQAKVHAQAVADGRWDEKNNCFDSTWSRPADYPIYDVEHTHWNSKKYPACRKQSILASVSAIVVHGVPDGEYDFKDEGDMAHLLGDINELRTLHGMSVFRFNE
jgi:hypothetical protein